MATSLKDQLKTTYNKAERARIQADLNAVNAQLAQIAGLGGTMAAPSAAGAGGKSSGWGKAQVVK